MNSIKFGDCRKMDTGYYATLNRPRSKVHLNIDGYPACHSHINKDMEFQWCAPGIKMDYLECEHCIKIGTRILEQLLQTKKFGK